MFSLKGKSAVITGGGSGIGNAMATLFAKQGAVVHIIELNAEAAEQTVKQITDDNGFAFSYSCDVSDQQQVIDVFSKIGNVNILVNNAGIAHIGKLETTTSKDFENIFNVNVKGAYNCMFAAIPKMKVNGEGVILKMTSIAALVGIPDRFAYSMSKGPIYAMTLPFAK